MTGEQILRSALRRPLSVDPADPEVWAFHRRMPGYAPTPLYDVPAVASALGVGRVLVKAEVQRLGLPSFKILGASWASYRAIGDHLGGAPEPWADITDLAARLAPMRPFALAAATDGNHGRAVAFMARLLGFDARIFVPAGTVSERIDAIRDEGATVTVVDGDYDDAVARSAAEAADRCLVISDTSWPGYETAPRRVVEGYSTIFGEVDEALDAADIAPPDAVFAPVGVGALMAAAVHHYRAGQPGPLLVGVEPTTANCLQASVRAGTPTRVPGPHTSMMAGLNCGTPSLIAWPDVAAGVDAWVSVDDDRAGAAMRTLAANGIVAGETGAASLAGLEVAGQELALGRESTVLLLVTEGATDPINYLRIVGIEPHRVERAVTAVGDAPRADRMHG